MQRLARYRVECERSRVVYVFKQIRASGCIEQSAVLVHRPHEIWIPNRVRADQIDRAFEQLFQIEEQVEALVCRVDRGFSLKFDQDVQIAGVRF